MLPNYSWPDPQQRADELAPVAEQLVHRIRAEDPTGLCSELLGRLDGWQLWGVVCLLAAAVDPSVHPDVWWGWVRYGDALARAEPIAWADDELPIEDLDVAACIRSLAARRRSDEEIAEATGLTAGAVAARRRRMGVPPGLRRGDVRTARVGVG